MSKYAVGEVEGDDYRAHNLLGLTTDEQIATAEFSGTYWAEIAFAEALTPSTRFTMAYVLELHRLCFGHLYAFAGHLRTVNISKEGFLFPVACFLEAGLGEFERRFLRPLANAQLTETELIRIIARAHAELLYLHPFREGNGRVARILANLMASQRGYQELNFGQFQQAAPGYRQYVSAVQQAARGEYELMESIISAAWTGRG